jgi:chromosome segregation ATPase
MKQVLSDPSTKADIKQINTRIDKLDSRIDKVEKRLNKVEKRLDKVEKRLDKVEIRLDALDKKIDDVEKRLRLEIRLSVQESTRQIMETMTKFKDIILTTVDPLLQELETRREDRIIAAKDTYEIKQRLDRLEKLQHIN